MRSYLHADQLQRAWTLLQPNEIKILPHFHIPKTTFNDEESARVALKPYSQSFEGHSGRRVETPREAARPKRTHHASDLTKAGS